MSDPKACPWCGGNPEIDTMTTAMEKIPRYRVRVVRCTECVHWEPSNAEEGDYSGRCRNRGPCQNQQTDGTWFCEDGAGMEVDHDR